jgi:hypothetical protein
VRCYLCLLAAFSPEEYSPGIHRSIGLVALATKEIPFPLWNLPEKFVMSPEVVVPPHLYPARGDTIDCLTWTF